MRFSFRLGLSFALAAGLFSAGCGLVFLPPLGQHLDFTFRLAEALERGEKRLVATWIMEDGIDTRRRTLQISGALGRPEGERLPQRIDIVATVTDPATGRVRQRLRLTAEVRPEDRFRVSKKVRRDLEAGSQVEVTVEPVGDDLPAGTEIRLCLDLVAAKGDVRDFASCAAGAGPTTFQEIQTQILTPSCAIVGCHDTASAAAGLNLEDGQSFAALVDAPSSQIFRRLRVDPGKPDDSYLVQKLRGSSTIMGGRMPLGGPFLSDDQVSGVVEWVENGARAE